MKTASGASSPLAGSNADGGGGDGHIPATGVHPGDGAAGHVLLPASQQTLVDAAYQREGSDLVLVDGHGARTLVPDFFAHDALPSLRTPDGALLSGDFAATLAGNPSHVQIADASFVDHQLAQAAGAAKGAPIGEVDVIKGTVTATHVDGTKAVLAKGDPVFMRDLLESEKGGSVGLVFADKTTFALGEDGRMRLDELVYNPASKSGNLGVSVLKGAFVFVSGDIAASQSEAMTVRTPVGTIGIRGTSVGGNISGDTAGSTITLLADPSGHIGAVQITNAGGTQYLTQLNQSVSITSFFVAPSTPFIANLLQLGAFSQVVGDLPPLPAGAPGGIVPQIGLGQGGGRGPNVGPQGGDTGAGGGPHIIVVTLGGEFSLSFGALAAKLGYTPLELQSLLALIEAPPPHVFTLNIFTLGFDNFTHQDGNNHFDATTIVNSLQWGDIADGGTLGHNELTARFAGFVNIDGPGAPPFGQNGPIPPGALSLKNIETITFVLLPGTNLTLDAIGIQAALDGTRLVIEGSGTITIDHAHDMTIDLSQFTGNYTINLDPDAGLSLIPGALAVGGGVTGNAVVNASLTTVGKILIDSAGNDTLLGGSGADTFVGVGGVSNLFAGGGDNDVYGFAHGAGLTPGTTIEGGQPALLTNGQLGHSEIRFESTTPNDTLVLNANMTSSENLMYVEIANDAAYVPGNYNIPGFDQGDRTGTTDLAINASAAPFHLVIKGNDGDDTLIASNHGDTIFTGTGSNFLQGGLGADSLDASAAAAASKEVFLFASGAAYTGDTIVSGANTNEIRFTSGTAGDTLHLSANITDPTNTALVTVSNDTVSGEGSASLASVTALAIDASAAPFHLTIDGNAGNDTLIASSHGDTIVTGAGSNFLEGGAGADNLNAAAAAAASKEVFLFASGANYTGDTITSGANTNEIRFTSTTPGDVLTLNAHITDPANTVLVTASNDTVSGEGLASLAAATPLTIDATSAPFRVTIDGNAGNDTLTGTSTFNDTIAAGNGANSIVAGAGADSITAGNGGDTVSIAGAATADTIRSGSGNDLVIATVSQVTAATSIDLGAGSDTLRLNDIGATNVDNLALAALSNIETLQLIGTHPYQLTVDGASNSFQTINGSAASGNDTIVLSGYTITGGTIDLGGGTDTLTLANGANSANVANVESILGGTGNDTVVLTTALVGGTIDLGAGTDTLTLSSAGANSVQVAHVESILGGAGNDTVVLTAPLVGGTIDLAGGSDTLTLASGGANSVQVAHVESILGGTGNDTVVLTAAIVGATIDLGSGADTLTLASGGANSVTVANVESILGGTGADTVVLTTALVGGTIDLGSGSDTLTLSSAGANSVTVANVESILGGTGADTVVLTTTLVGGTIDLGSGSDTLTLASGGANSVNVANVESLLGGTGNDTIVLTTPIVGSTIDLGSGSDTLTLASGGANSVTVANVESILGGTGADTVVLTTALVGGTIDLGSGSDTLTLSSAGANSVQVANVESILGGTGADTVVLTAALVGGTIDLGSGSDTLTLSSAGANSVQVANVESILGGSSNDTVVLTTSIVGSTIDLGSGSDTLTLASGGANSVTVANVESILGGTGADTVVLTTVLTGGTIDLGSGSDTLTLANGANSINVANVESLLGGTGNDTIVLTAAIVGSTIDLGSGSDTLTLANGVNSVTVANTESILGGTGADTVVLTTVLTGGTIDLGSGADTLTLANGANSINVANVESLLGGTGNDT
ncbi:MAG TPA: FecR domain-containing protein, partial [Candidatus Sulfotelmatobacter sp.]|nr:FecR domain-containing protein [Candidatus Sulfotelmatobacter sp.]